MTEPPTIKIVTYAIDSLILLPELQFRDGLDRERIDSLKAHFASGGTVEPLDVIDPTPSDPAFRAAYDKAQAALGGPRNNGLGRWVILDGVHRYTAAKELDLDKVLQINIVLGLQSFADARRYAATANLKHDLGGKFYSPDEKRKIMLYMMQEDGLWSDWSTARIASELHVGSSTASRWINELSQMGMLTVDRSVVVGEDGVPRKAGTGRPPKTPGEAAAPSLPPKAQAARDAGNTRLDEAKAKLDAARTAYDEAKAVNGAEELEKRSAFLEAMEEHNRIARQTNVAVAALTMAEQQESAEPSPRRSEQADAPAQEPPLPPRPTGIISNPLDTRPNLGLKDEQLATSIITHLAYWKKADWDAFTGERQYPYLKAGLLTIQFVLNTLRESRTDAIPVEFLATMAAELEKHQKDITALLEEKLKLEAART